MPVIEQLNEIQLDALQETGNIGCSHAATAISQMVSKQISISVPVIKIKKIEELKNTLQQISGSNEKLVGVYLELTKDFLGSILFAFPYQSALNLADILMCQPPGTAKELDEMGQSAITEVGNIVVSAYTNALGALLNTEVMLSPPTFAHDMPGAIIDNILKTLGNATHALIFDTQFKGEQNIFTSYFILLPSPQSLDALLGKLASRMCNGCSDAEMNSYIDSLSSNLGNKKNG